MSDPSDLPGAHLALPEEGGAGESIVKVVQRMFVKSFAWIGIYLLGYYDFSIAWLVTPLFLTALRSQWKKERDSKLNAARHAALSNEKEMIESRIKVEDLPSWVFFPDKERAEWINSIIQQLWPNVGHYTRKLITESIEPATRGALEGYGLSGFKFERVVLGQIPPRITGIKVYDKNVSRNEIIMDMDLVFASDCDIKFSVGKIKAKIMDFSLRGLLRVVFKPIINDMPLIGGVQAYFLNSPEIDFDLGGIANAFDAPGLSNIIRKIVLEQIGYFMVLPHKYTMPLAANVENKVLKCPDSAGVLRVRLHKAVQLVKKDVGVLGMGKSDPYALLTVGARTVKTHKINNTVNPEWNFTADFPIEVVKGQQLTLEIMDHDDPGDDEFLGRATVQTSVVSSKGEIKEMWVELEDIVTGRALLSLSWMETTTDKSQIDRPRPKEEARLTKCLLHVYVDGCKDLQVSKGSAQSPSPRVELRVGQEDAQYTFPKYYSAAPVFEQGFVFMVVSPESDDLHIKVLDTAHKDAVIGYTVVRVSDIVDSPNMEMVNQPFHLQGGSPSSSIVMAAQVRALLEPRMKPAVRPAKKKPVENVAAAAGTKTIPKVEGKQEAVKPVVVTDPEPATPMETAKKPEPEASSSPPEPSQPETVVEDTVAKVAAAVAVTEEAVDVSGKPEMDDLLNPLNALRKRGGEAAAANDDATGRIRIGLEYNQDKEKLRVTVQSASGLPGSDLPDPPDPYVKLYLLPDRNKKSKRKTEVMKDTTEPVYDEVFDYEIDVGKLPNCELEVSVVDKKGIFAIS